MQEYNPKYYKKHIEELKRKRKVHYQKNKERIIQRVKDNYRRKKKGLDEK